VCSLFGRGVFTFPIFPWWRGWLYVYWRSSVKCARQARRADLSICPMALLFCKTESGCSVWSSWRIIWLAGVVTEMVWAPFVAFAYKVEKLRMSSAVRIKSGFIWATKLATYSVEGASCYRPCAVIKKSWLREKIATDSARILVKTAQSF